MLFLSALKWACSYTNPRKRWQRFRIVISSMEWRRVEAAVKAIVDLKKGAPVVSQNADAALIKQEKSLR
jgi:hypothetical protein